MHTTEEKIQIIWDAKSVTAIHTYMRCAIMIQSHILLLYMDEKKTFLVRADWPAGIHYQNPAKLSVFSPLAPVVINRDDYSSVEIV